MSRKIIIGGGTYSHVRNHLALCAPAFGTTARKLFNMRDFSRKEWELHLTKMADPSSEMVTNQDVAKFVDTLVADPKVKVVVFNPAMCDFDGAIGMVESGKYAPRMKTRVGVQLMYLTPAEKIVKRIRSTRKDIFLAAFKTTSGATEQEQYLEGLNLLKSSSCNLVLANDTATRLNMVIVPEEAKYYVTTDRDDALAGLMNLIDLRAGLTYTRSTVVPGPLVPWGSPQVPENLREVVNHCIKAGAYKPFRGSTAGHFAARVGPNKFLTSVRKSNYQKLTDPGYELAGLVEVSSNGPDEVLAVGHKPSVGGQSQRIVFEEHPGYDCIVHFHCPPKNYAALGISVRSQAGFECGSHECGQNTSDGLEEYSHGLKVVYLDNHGPNVVFKRTTPAQEVIDLIDSHFDLSQKTGGPVELSE